MIKNGRSTQRFKRDLPTIGMLAGWSALEGTSPDHYFTAVISGLQSAARIRRCHLLVSWEIHPIMDRRQIKWAWPAVSPDSDFVPVGPWNTDGLIVFTPLENEFKSLYIRQLVAEGQPILFIGTGEPGPQIAVDNSMGIRQAMAHLVEHGHRRIAFIAGVPTDKGDSETRLQAYRAAVTEYSLETDPRLVVWGWHDLDEGYKAMQALLASGIKFTAVLASNDNSAIGAMRAIKEAGLRIPADIAIIGFDDQRIAAMQVPPLTSIHTPLPLIGEQALVTMLDHLTQRMPLETVRIPTRLVRRQTCGCVPDDSSAFHWMSQTEPVSRVRGEQSATAQELKKQVVNGMMDSLPAELRYPAGEAIRAMCTGLVEAFHKSLEETTAAHFQAAFMEWIAALEKGDGNFEPWQDMISALRRDMTLLPVEWGRNETRLLALEMLYQVVAAIGTSTRLQDQRHQYQRAADALALHTLTAHLSAALSKSQVLEILDAGLAGAGIRHARVMFFEAEQDDPVAWSVVFNVDSGPAAQRFPSREFPPPGLYSPDEILNVVLLPLIFQSEVLGYVAFDAGNLGACAVIAIQLAATIKVSQLHAQVVELSLTDALTGLQNRRSFEFFLKNEISRSRRFSRGLAIILVDVDRFKEYNDTYGHPAGDEALQWMARCLLEARRGADIVARLGGDEFAIILPETDQDGALKVGRKIRAVVAAQSDLKRALSVSIGLTVFLGAGMDAQSLIQQADTALYDSKRRGRNRISIYTADRIVDEGETHPLPGD